MENIIHLLCIKSNKTTLAWKPNNKIEKHSASYVWKNGGPYTACGSSPAWEVASLISVNEAPVSSSISVSTPFNDTVTFIGWTIPSDKLYNGYSCSESSSFCRWVVASIWWVLLGNFLTPCGTTEKIEVRPTVYSQPKWMTKTIVNGAEPWVRWQKCEVTIFEMHKKVVPQQPHIICACIKRKI